MPCEHVDMSHALQLVMRMYGDFPGVNPVDFKVRSGLMMGFAVAKPKIPGGDLAGVVEQGVGKVCACGHGFVALHVCAIVIDLNPLFAVLNSVQTGRQGLRAHGRVPAMEQNG